MLAARIYNAKDLRMEEVPNRKLQTEDEIKVLVSAAGICGSDLHVYQTGAYLSRTPVTMGHEFSGRIVAVGKESCGFQVGDHVVGDSRVYCSTCRYCLEDKHNLCTTLGFLGEVCDGAFSEEIIVPARNLLKINDNVPAHIAALAEPLAVALHAVNMSNAQNSKKVLIFGAGPIGALIHTVLSIQGIQDMAIVDISQYRRNAVRALNSDSRISAAPVGEYDLIFETTGAGHILQNLLFASMSKGGRAILVGLFAQENCFNFTEIVENEWELRGCSCFDTELSAAVNLLENHGPLFEHIVSHQLPLSNTPEGFDILLDREKTAMKIILTP